MFKKILILIFFMLGTSITFGICTMQYDTECGKNIDSNYYEYANIPGTDIIEFNSQINNKIYKVYVNTGEIFYITGSDNKLHTCFPIIGTGYTEKLGEIYFQYEGKGSYICSDSKLRGVFKIGAGGWGYMEDLENNPEKWKLFLNKKPDNNGDYYHSEDGNDNGTGQAWLEGIGYSNWNNARTVFNIKELFNNNISAQVIANARSKVANGYNTGSISIILKYKNSPLKNFKVDGISFISGYNSDVYRNGNIIPGYKYNGNLTTNNTGQIIGTIISYIGGNRTYGIKIKVGDNEIIKTGNINFKYPFELNLYLTGEEIPSKTVIGYNNKIKIITGSIDDNISNLHFNNIIGTLDLGMYKDYFTVTTGKDIHGINNYTNLKIIGDISKGLFYSGDKLDLSYKINGTYTYKISGNTYKINNFNLNTPNKNIYKYGKVDHIQIVKDTTDIPMADGKQVFWYNLKFLNKNNYPINNLSFNLSNFKDYNKFFDLNDETHAYETGFFITGNNNLANVNGTYKIGIISYKPVSNAELTGIIENIQYTGNSQTISANQQVILKNISFTSPVGMNFENKILKANQKDTFKVSYVKNITNISNPNYNFTGYIKGCSDCIFSGNEGKYISNNNFEDKTFNIYISGSHTPDAVIYTGYYNYNLNGDYGNKTVKNYFRKEYSPIIYVNKGKIKLIGLAGSDKKILGGVNYISTALKPYIMKNLLKKYIITSIRGYKEENIDSNTDINLSNLNKINIYKCSNNEILNIQGTYTGDKKIISLGCEININGNILSNKGHLEIFSYKKDNNIDFIDINGWKNKGNIYIKENVDTIQASLYTNGSIFTYLDNINNGVFTGRAQEGFKRQLYIYGQVFSKNTIGGGSQDKNLKFTILGGKKINNNDKIFGIDGYIVAQAYDVNFWRTSLLESETDTNYDTGNLSSIIKNKYNCTGNKNNDPDICYSSIIIENNLKK